MPSYLLELYLPRGRSLEDAVAVARQAAEAMAREGIPVEYVRSMHLAEDETCFHLLEAVSREAVLAVARRAGLTGVRVTETVESRELALAPSEKEK